MNYRKLKQIQKLYFGYEEVARILGITLQSARVACARFVKNGLLVRLKKNIYLLRDRWESLTKEEQFLLANIIQTPSYVSLMTAMDYYEITTQMQRKFIESVAVLRTKDVEIEGNVFNYTKIKKELYFGFAKEKGFFIASPEKAFLDALYLASLKRYSFDLSSINPDKLDAAKIRKIIKKYPKKTRYLLDTYGYFKET